MPTKTIAVAGSLCLAVAVIIIMTIATTRETHEKTRDLWASVNLKGADKWFSLAGLRMVSDAHLLKREPQLGLNRFDVTANVHTDDPSKLVTFQYYENFGLPVFYVTLDKVGKVAGVSSRIASEKLDVTVSPPASPNPRK